jgi:hypothetical protein
MNLGCSSAYYLMRVYRDCWKAVEAGKQPAVMRLYSPLLHQAQLAGQFVCIFFKDLINALSDVLSNGYFGPSVKLFELLRLILCNVYRR